MDCKFILFYTLSLFLIINISNANSECAKSLCVTKCCPENEYFYNSQCDTLSRSTIKSDFSELNVSDSNLKIVGKYKGGVQFVEKKPFEVIPSVSRFSAYLLENGKLYTKIVLPNAFPKINIVENEKFCVEHSQNSDGTVTPAYAVYEESTTKDMTLTIIALIISCIFLLLVFIIIPITNKFDNIKVTMAMVFSFFGAYSTLATHQIIMTDDSYVLKEEECLGFTCTVYFFFLSAFCWMNVLSFEMWTTFRCLRKRRDITICGIKHVFPFYCLYARGLPFVLTIALKVIDEADLSERPWIIKPNIISGGCFLSGKEKILYLYIPMLISVLCNWVFFLWTAYIIWRTRGCLDNLNKSNSKESFLIYLKLSLVMGLTYILEAGSSLYPDSPFWCITDAYNMFIGVAFFLIFVCKKEVFAALSRRLCGTSSVDTVLAS